MRNNIESNPPTLLIIYCIFESEADIMLDVLVAEIILNITNEINKSLVSSRTIVIFNIGICRLRHLICVVVTVCSKYNIYCILCQSMCLHIIHLYFIICVL